MVKRRDSSKYSRGGGGGGNDAAGRSYGGGGGDVGKFSVFEFADADLRVENESRKNLARFVVKSPSKKSAHHRQSADKYRLLECCTTKEQSSYDGKFPKTDDCEPVVSVEPKYVIYKNRCYNGQRLMFSRNCIRLERSPHCDPGVPCCVEWFDIDILKIECQQCESARADVVKILMRLKNTRDAETGYEDLDLHSDPSSLPPNAHYEEFEFEVLKSPHWYKKQEEIKSLDLQYKSAWRTITCASVFDESFEGLVYPEGDPDAVFISRDDIWLLQPKTFINDTLIDFYMKYLLTKIKQEESHRFYFFNTFFFQKLVDIGQDTSGPWDGGKAFQRVRKWTRHVNLFEKDHIFIPINYSLHWSLIVICHPGEVANSREIGTNNSSKIPCIIHMDSIRGSHRGLENVIQRYLWEEWKKQWNKQGNQIAWKFRNMKFFQPQLPQQENLTDCGLFLLHYAELFLGNVTSTRTPTFDFLHKDWFHPDEVSLKKRDQIRNLIYRIAERKSFKQPQASCDDKYLRTTPNKGDGSAKSTRESGLKESRLGVKVHSEDDFHEFKVSSDERCQPHNQSVPINEFSNMRFPTKEEGRKRWDKSPRHDKTILETRKHDEGRTPLTRKSSSLLTGSPETSCCFHLPKLRCAHNDEEKPIRKVAETEKKRYEICLSSSSNKEEDLIVEDSEDENRTDIKAKAAVGKLRHLSTRRRSRR
ncbi:probable ubiquitin-like-specific protease 2B isoform X2 [Andrographis paniculata]|uniref:probable ubiquitin-like-specific protease 2B isoform X2 n=1 Tax=Andrographis paniculata TaxID=175694 RepID=UPI0021E91787|nr:probable ubiquitin-like-specific protease 2B isoform X2 [Andrographis paniculata]